MQFKIVKYSLQKGQKTTEYTFTEYFSEYTYS